VWQGRVVNTECAAHKKPYRPEAEEQKREFEAKREKVKD
jgi:hypothetical protein